MQTKHTFTQVNQTFTEHVVIQNREKYLRQIYFILLEFQFTCNRDMFHNICNEDVEGILIKGFCTLWLYTCTCLRFFGQTMCLTFTSVGRPDDRTDGGRTTGKHNAVAVARVITQKNISTYYHFLLNGINFPSVFTDTVFQHDSKSFFNPSNP